MAWEAELRFSKVEDDANGRSNEQAFVYVKGTRDFVTNVAETAAAHARYVAAWETERMQPPCDCSVCEYNREAEHPEPDACPGGDGCEC